MPDFRRKARAVTGSVVRKARSIVSSTAGKRANVRRVTQLNADISSERDSIKRAYTEIGKLYYETHKEAPDDYFVRLCQDIDRSMTSISSMEAEIMQLKTGQSPSPADEPAAEQ